MPRTAAGRVVGGATPRRGLDRRAVRTRIASRRWKSRARAGPGTDRHPEVCATRWARTWRRFWTRKHPTLPDPADRKLDRAYEGNETGSGAPGPVSLLVGATLGTGTARRWARLPALLHVKRRVLSVGSNGFVTNLRQRRFRCSRYRRYVRQSLTTARCIVGYDIGAAPSPAGLLRYRPGATGSDDRNDRRTPGVEGAVAQLGERCNRTAEVRGSTPLSSIWPRFARHGFRLWEELPAAAR